MKVWAEADRRTALAGADFVITCFSVGGFDSMRHDIEIPQRYGIRAADRRQRRAGRLTRALRSVPVLLDIARDVDDDRSRRVPVNVTNPLTALCRSVTRETNVKTVGLCNEWVATTFMLSLLFDCGMHEIDPVLGGREPLPAGDGALGRPRRRLRAAPSALDDPEGSRGVPDLDGPARGTGLEKSRRRPLDASSTCSPTTRCESSSSSGSACSRARVTTTRRVRPRFRPRRQRLRQGVARAHLPAREAHAPTRTPTSRTTRRSATPTTCPSMPSGELVATADRSIVTGRARNLPVNLPNAGNVTNLPDGAVVEIMGTVDARRRDRPRHHDRAERDGGVAAPRQRRRS